MDPVALVFGACAQRETADAFTRCQKVCRFFPPPLSQFPPIFLPDHLPVPRAPPLQPSETFLCARADCDGTLVDTMGGFYTADLRTCEEFGLTMSKKQFYDLAGVPIREIFKILAEAQGKTPDLDAMAARCKEIADELMHEGPGLIHPVVAIARDAKAKGLPVAVASSGVKPTVTGGDFPRLNGIHLLSYPLGPTDTPCLY